MPSAKGGEHDGGVGRRMAGAFMTQLQDIKEPVFWLFTMNSMEGLHEAFMADDRVDGIVYVPMPGPAQLAAGWKMYLKKFFPETVGGQPYPRHLSTDFAAVCQEFEKEMAPRFDLNWIERFVAALLCVPREDERAQALATVKKLSDGLHGELADSRVLVNDQGWTLARVKSCCRLARKRKKTLGEIARTMPRTQKALEAAIAKLETWASEEAIDAETGEAFSLEGREAEVNSQPKSPQRIKARRSVQRS